MREKKLVGQTSHFQTLIVAQLQRVIAELLVPFKKANQWLLKGLKDVRLKAIEITKNYYGKHLIFYSHYWTLKIPIFAF